MPLEQRETIEIDSLSLENHRREEFWRIREINKEKRTNLYHLVIHLLAFIIVIPFIFFIIFSIEMPEVYSTLVSVIIGFYFAKSLFKD